VTFLSGAYTGLPNILLCGLPRNRALNVKGGMRRFGRPRTRIETVCPICGTTFEAHPSEVKRGGGRYCSYVCSAEAARRRVKAVQAPQPRQPKVERTCETCLKVFLVYPYRASSARPARFCSDVCRRTLPVYRAIKPDAR
jgi:hypothetical protein